MWSRYVTGSGHLIVFSELDPSRIRNIGRPSFPTHFDKIFDHISKFIRKHNKFFPCPDTMKPALDRFLCKFWFGITLSAQVTASTLTLLK